MSFFINSALAQTATEAAAAPSPYINLVFLGGFVIIF